MAVGILPRKEVIQPQLPLRLPCYDFVPIAGPTLDACLLAVSPAASGVTNFHDVTGGVYKARERIHRSNADLRLPATSAFMVGGFQPAIPTGVMALMGLAPRHRLAALCTTHCSVCVAPGVRATLT